MRLEEDIINFADVHQKRKFLANVGALSVPHEITMKPYKPRRSNKANAYYWKVIVTAFCRFREDQNDYVSKEAAHDFIVRRTLGEREIINPRTGVVDTMRRETHVLDTPEFSEFVEKAHAFLADYGIETQTRDEYERMGNDALGVRKEKHGQLQQDYPRRQLNSRPATAVPV